MDNWEFFVKQFDENNLNIYSLLKVEQKEKREIKNGKCVITDVSEKLEKKKIVTVNGTKGGETVLLDVNMFTNVAYNYLVDRVSLLTLFQNTFEVISDMVTFLNGGNDSINIRKKMTSIMNETEAIEGSYDYTDMKRYFVSHSLGEGIASYVTEHYNIQEQNKTDETQKNYAYGIPVNPPSMKDVAFNKKEYYRGYTHAIVTEIEALSSFGRKITDKITQLPCDDTFFTCHKLSSLESIFYSQENIRKCKT